MINKTIEIYAPTALRVKICFYKKANENKPTETLDLLKKGDKWILEKIYLEKFNNYNFYSFKVQHSEYENFDNLPDIPDPYSKALTTFTDYFNPRKSVILNSDFNWEDDTFLTIDHEKLVIYEAHLKDLTAHSSSESRLPGTYLGFIDSAKGGINHLKSLGINAIEFLPIFEFAYYESPFLKEYKSVTNSWNPYEINHWGYMTAGYFAPTAFYSEAHPRKPNSSETKKWIGTTGKQVNEFKTVIKELHKNKIAVILDVVFNHASEYEVGGLKQIDKSYYFRHDRNGILTSESLCGNDLKTENPTVRKLILDSIKYWMLEYHIDGFRFDLANLIDQITLEEITKLAKEINPNVILIAEPWGGGYNPKRFSKMGWSSWNDKFRNTIKGENPTNNPGFIFGKNFGRLPECEIKKLLLGTIHCNDFGLFEKPIHSINYLESHDGFTLADFIRISLNNSLISKKITNPDKFVQLNTEQLQINKLAAFILFTSFGIPMIHEGQEFGHTKIITKQNEVNDPNVNELDANSYEKDNETNYINFNHKNINTELFNFYKKLISFRKKYFRFFIYENVDVKFNNVIYSDFILKFTIRNKNEELLIIINADQTLNANFETTNKHSSVIFSDNNYVIKSNLISVNPSSGIILYSPTH